MGRIDTIKTRPIDYLTEVEPWFVGKDVADTLGYQNSSRDINRHVDDEDRHKVMLFDGKQQAIWLTAYRLHVLLNNRKENKNERQDNS